MAKVEEIQEMILNGAPYLEDEKPFLEMGDIAEELEVSKETVRRNVDDVVGHPNIKRTKAGQATVFWRTQRATPPWSASPEDDTASEEVLSEYFRVEREKLIAARASWLQMDQELRVGERDVDSPEDRFEAWRVLAAYLDSVDRLGNISFGVAAQQAELPDEYAELIELDEYDTERRALPDGFGSFEEILYEKRLFEAPFGEDVRGVAMLIPHHVWTRTQLGDSPDPEDVDEIVPSGRDILYAGGVLDELISRVYGFYW